MQVWLRAEHKTSERRTPLTPEGAEMLLRNGYSVTVERSSNRIFSDGEYEGIGCTIQDAGEWVKAPKEAYILGLKELPASPDALVHRHIFFGHAYKGQPGSNTLLDRFRKGGGNLLDLEYLVDNKGQRAAAFGYWAGYIGASLALIHFGQKSHGGVHSTIRDLLPSTDRTNLDKVTSLSFNSAALPNVLIIGASGRSGTGAKDCCLKHGILITEWDKKDTISPNYDELLKHNILINCALITKIGPPFLDWEVLDTSRNLSLVMDVSCDQGSALNPLPISSECTTWADPVQVLLADDIQNDLLEIIAIDNLPTLLPKESSLDFAAALLPHLINLKKPNDEYWLNSQRAFEKAIIMGFPAVSDCQSRMKL